MKRAFIVALIFATPTYGMAQDAPKTLFYQSAGAGPVTWTSGQAPGVLVQGAPYSATITNEMVQSLADGNRIVQTTTGTTARDSQGRTRQDMALPAIGNLSAANAPHLVFIQDPVAQTFYTLNLTDKTAQKMPMPPALPGGAAPAGPGSPGGVFFLSTVGAAPLPPLPPNLPPPPAAAMVTIRSTAGNDATQGTTEDLGSQTIEGVLANGVRTTHTIPAGQIGNDKPLSVVTEVWTSPDLKTIVSSKRSDPRTGEQTFRLTNIVREEPDPSLFSVPSDFRIVEGPANIVYRTNP